MTTHEIAAFVEEIKRRHGPINIMVIDPFCRDDQETDAVKFTPVPSSSPVLLVRESVETTTEGHSIRLEVVGDSKAGRVCLSLGVGTDARRSREWLTRDQTNELIRKMQQLITIM